MRYQMIDHTADLGLRVFGETLPGLYETAAWAMFEQIVDTDGLAGAQQVDLVVDGADREDLMINWLRELLFLWAGKRMLVKKTRIRRLSDRHLTASAAVDAYDARRHEIKTEIKAVTYHRVQVVRCRSGWRATVIFDL